MAGIGEILALAAAGYLINERTPKVTPVKKNKKSKKERTNATDIYNQNNSREVRDEFETKGKKRYQESLDFRNTRMIPKDYKEFGKYLDKNKGKIRIDENENTTENIESSKQQFRGQVETIRGKVVEGFDDDSQYSDQETRDSLDDSASANSNGTYNGFTSDPTSVIDKMSSLTNNRKFESCVAKQSRRKRDKFNENNTWTNQFDQMTFDNMGDPVSVNGVNRKTSGKNADSRRIELERDMELNGGYSMFDGNDDGTYGVVRPESRDFIHENMVPNVRRGPSAIQEAKRAEANTSRLNLFTGSADQIDWKPKVERAPLFSPLVGVVNIYGDPVRTSEFESRYFAGKEQRNTLPFKQVKVTPGLDIGYNAVGKQGYHDMYRVIDPGVDELRPLSKPKISELGSYVGPGKKGDKGPVQGRVAQNRTPRFRERGTDDLVRGRSYITAPTIYGEYNQKNLATVNRGVKETLAVGPAQHHLEGLTPDEARGRWRESMKENYKYDHPRNVLMHESLKGQGHNNESFVPDQTQREMKNRKGSAYWAAGGKQYVVDYAGATPDSTMREVHAKYDRAGHTTGSKQSQRTIDYSDVPNQTMRDIHSKPDRAGHTTGNKQQIRAFDYSDVPDQTMRNVHDKLDRSGHVSGNSQQYRAVDYNDVPDQNMRNIHDKPDRSGHVSGNREQYQTIDWNDVGDPTMRDIHNKYDRSGHLTGNREGYQSVNWVDVPDQTMRDIHSKPDRSGHIKGNKEQYRAINYNDLPDPTMRDIHNEPDRSGHVSGNREQYKAIDYDDVPDPNMRNVHDKPDRAGHTTGNRQQYRAVDYDDVPNPNMRNVHSKPDRSGHVSGNRQQYRAIDYDDVPDPNMRNVHSKPDRSGHVSGNRQQYRAVDYDDVPDPNMRNIHSKPDRSGHVSGNRQQYRAVDYDDVPDATMRNIHDKPDRSGHVSGNRQQYRAVDYDDVTDPTMREIHSKPDRSGHVSGNRQQYRAVDYDDVPEVTMREIHSKPDRSGHVSGNRQQYRAVDYDDIPEVTMREIHSKPDRSGNVSGNREQYRAIDYNDVPEVTMREIHGKSDRSGHVSGNKEQYKAIDYSDVPDVTMREIHGKMDRAGVVTDNRQQYRTIDYSDVPDVTMREIHPGGRTGGAQSRDLKQGSRHQYMNMKINGAKEALEEGRAPTKIGMNKGWSIDETAFQFRNPVEGKWRSGPGSDMMYKNDTLGITSTRIPTGKFHINDRILAFTEENLEGNPLVNNLIHRGI